MKNAVLVAIWATIARICWPQLMWLMELLGGVGIAQIYITAASLVGAVMLLGLIVTAIAYGAETGILDARTARYWSVTGNGG